MALSMERSNWQKNSEICQTDCQTPPPPPAAPHVANVPVDLTNHTECNGALTYSRVDATLRDAVAAARFQLAKARQATASTHCDSASWDGRKCMNDLMGASAAECHLVKIDDLCIVTRGATNCHPTAESVSTSEGRNEGTDTLRFFSDGRAMSTVGSLNECANDGSFAHKCIMKICGAQLKVYQQGSTQAYHYHTAPNGDKWSEQGRIKFSAHEIGGTLTITDQIVYKLPASGGSSWSSPKTWDWS